MVRDREQREMRLARWTEVRQRRTLYVNANVFEINPVDLWFPNAVDTPEFHKTIHWDSGRNY